MTDMFDKTLTDVDPNKFSNRIAVDLEDFGSSPVSSQLSRARKGVLTKMAQKRKAPELAVPAQTDRYASLPADMPSMTEDYVGWLQYQKKKWKIQKQAQKRRRQLFGEKRVDATDAIGAIFRKQAELSYMSTWQILQLRETDTPGEIKAYVLIDRKVHQLKVLVPRQLYLNLKQDDLPDVSVE
ncbi:DNA polymerase epsilon catalytic subunit, partial [Cryomyces antarcticus]